VVAWGIPISDEWARPTREWYGGSTTKRAWIDAVGVGVIGLDRAGVCRAGAWDEEVGPTKVIFFILFSFYISNLNLIQVYLKFRKCIRTCFCIHIPFIFIVFVYS
jgi:hypothetical protein